ncbi:conjugal transfer protein TraH [Escherichia coli]|uniref:conjugal transfer protein TraH n=1 Tax=Escherichia coli TaxID=562 RepID=UPI003D9A930B
MASDINSMNLSSCQAAQGLSAGFPRTQVSQQKVCQDIAGESNIFADWLLPGRDVPLAGNLTASG